MRALLVEEFGPVEKLKLADVPDPDHGSEEVLVSVRAADVTFPDILDVEGRASSPPPLPFVPGKAATGIVDAVGDSVTGFEPGQRVLVHVERGAFAEKVAAPGRHCFPVPEGVGFDKGAALGLAYQIAHFALRERADMTSGEVVLVTSAARGIGLAAAQLAKAFGAVLVMAGCQSEAEAETARAAGADRIIDLSTPEGRENLAGSVREQTDGYGADIVIDPLGGETNAAALRALAWRGRLVVVGFSSGSLPSIEARDLLVRNIGVSGLNWRNYLARDPAWVARVQAELFDLYLQDRIDPPITTYSPGRAADALASLRDGRAEGKGVLTFSTQSRSAGSETTQTGRR